VTIACWREIGVWGDRSCPQLPPVVHCSNCPVFVGEARSLLDRPIDAEYLAWLTETVANRAEEASPPDRVVLVFGAGGEWFAIDATAVRTVAPVGAVRRLPHRDDPAFLGLTAVRGELMPCLSLAALLGIPGDPSGAPPRTAVVLDDRDALTALLVDVARGVEGVRRSDTRSPPDTIAQTLRPVSEGLHRVGDIDVTLLDRAALAERIRGALV
jgi:chemotaxis-related protein WspD